MVRYEQKGLTKIIIGAAYEVHNILGAGFLEKVYRNALAKEITLQGLQANMEVKIPVYYKEALVGDYYADIVVEDKVIVELKALNDLSGQHEAQLLNYLKATGYKVGLLLNFGSRRVQVKRMVL